MPRTALFDIPLILFGGLKGVLCHEQIGRPALGIHLTMDDFGAGYSSLSYLKRFPLDRIKIDLTYVHDVRADPDDVATVHAIVAMAHQLRLHLTTAPAQ